MLTGQWTARPTTTWCVRVCPLANATASTTCRRRGAWAARRGCRPRFRERPPALAPRRYGGARAACLPFFGTARAHAHALSFSHMRAHTYTQGPPPATLGQRKKAPGEGGLSAAHVHASAARPAHHHTAPPPAATTTHAAWDASAMDAMRSQALAAARQLHTQVNDRRGGGRGRAGQWRPGAAAANWQNDDSWGAGRGT